MMRKRRWYTIGICVGVCLMMVGCLPVAKKRIPKDRPIRVVCTTTIVADAVRQIGGDRVSVTSLMGPNVDPHTYVVSTGDITTLSQADIVFYNGLGLEAKMMDVLSRLNGVTTVAVADAIPDNQRIVSAHIGVDPHVWGDVTLWKLAVDRICRTLVEVDSDHRGTYESRAGVYAVKLDALDHYIRERTGKLAPIQRTLITAHNGFQYFGRQYGYRIVGLGPQDVNRVTGLVVSRKIRAIFAEMSLPGRYIELVRSNAESGGWSVKIGGRLYSDALGDSDTFEGTYLGMMRHDVDVIVAALNGEFDAYCSQSIPSVSVRKQ